MQGNTLENRMAFKKLHSIESIVRAMRDTGPFGGASIDSISIPAIIKKADEQADRSVRKLVGGVGFQNMCKVMKVFFEDKYEKSNKILVEEIISEVLQIPDNVNGFEYLCHPYLEKEENLIKYFKSWHSTTLMSTYHLLENSPLSVYFLNPSGMEEREVANELRRKYNLVVECQEINIHLSNDAPKPDSSLDVLIKTRHYVKNLLFKLKISNLRNYSKIIEDLKVVKKEPNAVSHKRNRFFSEDLPENAIVSRRLYVQDLSGPGGRQSTEDSNVNSSELSGSFQSSNRPFRIQESLLEERAEITKRRMLSGGDQSFSVMFRKGRAL